MNTNTFIGILTLLISAALGYLSLWGLHRKRQPLTAGTVPNNFPPERVYNVGQGAVGNKLGNTGAFATTVFFTAPTPGFYMLTWAVKINSTDAAGSITLTVTPPHSVAIPGVQAAPATPSDGSGTTKPYWMNGGETVTASSAVSGLTGTNYDVYVFANRLS